VGGIGLYIRHNRKMEEESVGFLNRLLTKINLRTINKQEVMKKRINLRIEAALLSLKERAF
jgi:transcriptional regulator CtsR